MSQGPSRQSPITGTVSIGGANLSAFGDLISVDNTPIDQMDFVYGLNSQKSVSVVSGTGATIDTDSGRLRVQSGTNSAGYAIWRSLKPARYRAGQGMTWRGTPIFSNNAASSIQAQGMANLNAAGTSITDGYFFGYNGTSYGILHRNNSADAWTAQSSWNGDPLNGNGESGITLDPTKGTPCMIKYPYLGYGDITFWCQNPTTGAWILAHTIRYANTTATTQLTNPSMHLCAFVVNSGNTTNLTQYCGSLGIFLNGQRLYTGAQFGIDNNKATVTTETNIISLKNCTTYNGIPNRGVIRLRSLSIASDGGNGISVFRLKKGVTLGGSPSWTTISGSTADSGATITNGQSMVSYDTAGTTITGGTTYFNSNLARLSENTFDLTAYDIFILPGEVATFSMFCAASATAAVAVNWQEDN